MGRGCYRRQQAVAPERQGRTSGGNEWSGPGPFGNVCCVIPLGAVSGLTRVESCLRRLRVEAPRQLRAKAESFGGMS